MSAQPDLFFLLYLSLVFSFGLACLKAAGLASSPWDKDLVVIAPLLVVGAIAIASYLIFFLALILSVNQLFCAAVNILV